MKRMHGVGTVLAVVLMVAGAAGCSGGGEHSDGAAGTPSGSPTAATSSAPVPKESLANGLTVKEALDRYTAASAGGCQSADDCHFLMVRRLAASESLATAMQAKDPAAYAEPLRLQKAAEAQADRYGRDNLGAKGNYAAVNGPLQQMSQWLALHPGM